MQQQKTNDRFLKIQTMQMGRNQVDTRKIQISLAKKKKMKSLRNEHRISIDNSEMSKSNDLKRYKKITSIQKWSGRCKVIMSFDFMKLEKLE